MSSATGSAQSLLRQIEWCYSVMANIEQIGKMDPVHQKSQFHQNSSTQWVKDILSTAFRVFHFLCISLHKIKQRSPDLFSSFSPQSLGKQHPTGHSYQRTNSCIGNTCHPTLCINISSLISWTKNYYRSSIYKCRLTVPNTGHFCIHVLNKGTFAKLLLHMGYTCLADFMHPRKLVRSAVSHSQSSLLSEVLRTLFYM